MSDEIDKEISKRKAALNDLCRKAMGVAGLLVQTEGICAQPPAVLLVQTEGIGALPPAVQSAIREAVANYNEFGGDDDPYQERDLGAFEIAGVAETIFWKIDYYAPGLEGGSADPADPAQTVRVLTVMLESEY